MKRITFLLLLILLSCYLFSQSEWIRVNQVGYLEKDIKVAVWVNKGEAMPDQFQLIDISSGETVFVGNEVRHTGEQPAFKSSARLNFSAFITPGTYIIKAGETESPPFRIGNEVYAGAAEIPLQYMRQQRCGYNPCLNDSCHVHDGITVGDPDGKRNGLYFNTV
ncbi:MAG: Polysaccharide deacetylase, partial [Proteiniphilum acetatigenes]